MEAFLVAPVDAGGELRSAFTVAGCAGRRVRGPLAAPGAVVERAA
jgi:hypothetical protein